ncbi:xyloglucan-specific endo-beta-1 like protein [Verticillium longisporum]|uniref:Endoglucanase-1 n=4 Tax=Verticillium TaxID=1036719 RepID=G2X8Q3_VERDV|nr:uncharacterized protein VDAG_06194 [Verticillium dahliae VdLs.17]KAF3342239.1 Putative proteasome subunit beta type-2 [Verticillium dahliae VDG2]KAF3359059.1 hypothetical protein VdG1_02621 [Verticillium dahliae VDG1]KAG7140778.1 xyloglucan-specific endo-beta-1 like protein [Verticillium longisporum]KAH6697992.1 concanavalin A-like lectin/glucanase domain-containing protein [Verticillium dahliae]EGY15340.1 hypothetical protein VDAG_06194 [Verticillium dahliae VdLs.17]
MGLNFRFLVNVGLLGLPIAVTLGILFGLDQHRSATGQPPLWSPPGPPINNGITEETYCQRAFGIHPESKGQEYTLNPNQWGWEEGEPGSLCMNVTSFNNQTYATKTTAPEFSVTWEYPRGPESAPVHAFPNIKVEGDVFPATLSSLTEVNVDVEWTYGLGNDTVDKTDVTALEAKEVNTNVAIDMFLDSDKTTAKDSTKAAFEVMVWLGAIGPATQPIGLPEGSVATDSINGTDFNLYVGQNSLKQHVLTWVAKNTTEKFHGDLMPLVTKLMGMRGANFPKTTDYLGYMGLGSEALSTSEPVTFWVPELSIDIRTTP